MLVFTRSCKMKPGILFLMAVTVVLCYKYVAADSKQNQKTYIVHMDKSVMPSGYSNHFQWYETSMRSVSTSTKMLYAYNKVIHGFSTRLTVEEAKLLEQQHGIVSVQEEVIYKLHTTRSPKFLGLERSDIVITESKSTGDVIIGVVDTGLWPGSKSLDDTGYGPIPKRWKGRCQSGKGFNKSSCNRKLIGARYFAKGYIEDNGPIDEKLESRSPTDDRGHGTHCATTAAGSPVTGANLLGFANGTARGMAPHARLAIYKACWDGGCFGSDVLAAYEMAITDGVDVLSVSIGAGNTDYAEDVFAFGAFKAVSHGIFVSTSAGNDGPTPRSIVNVAPWMATVGAGSLDRDFPAYLWLGNGKKVKGLSINHEKALSNSMVPLVFAGNISTNKTHGHHCLSGSLPKAKAAGKIVMCERGMGSKFQMGLVVKQAGGLAMIIANNDGLGEELLADAHLIATVAVGKKGRDMIKRYIVSDPNSKAKITFGSTNLGVQPSPLVAAFSSRGPNPLTPKILKPDFIAPGVNILAGWTSKFGPTRLPEDTRRVEFNFASGTSMACPHVSGLAALIKGAHPEWSPAAIRSSLMTTSYSTYKDGKGLNDVFNGKRSTPFDHGSGHVDPVSALDPGLVYDASTEDYLNFLCASKYNSSSIKKISGGKFKCVKGKKYRVEDLNYPSFAVPLQTASRKRVVKYTRILTNVGTPATYKVAISLKIRGVKITVEPEELTFVKKNEKASYTVTFTALSKPSGTNRFARLTWSGGKYVVSSPIAFSWE